LPPFSRHFHFISLLFTPPMPLFRFFFRSLTPLTPFRRRRFSDGQLTLAMPPADADYFQRHCRYAIYAAFSFLSLFAIVDTMPMLSLF
jgi:hypothetical protein